MIPGADGNGTPIKERGTASRGVVWMPAAGIAAGVVMWFGLARTLGMGGNGVRVVGGRDRGRAGH